MELAVIFVIAVFCWWFSGKLFAPPRVVGNGTCKACKQTAGLVSDGYCRPCWDTNFGAFL